MTAPGGSARTPPRTARSGSNRPRTAADPHWPPPQPAGHHDPGPVAAGLRADSTARLLLPDWELAAGDREAAALPAPAGLPAPGAALARQAIPSRRRRCRSPRSRHDDTRLPPYDIIEAVRRRNPVRLRSGPATVTSIEEVRTSAAPGRRAPRRSR